MEQAWDDKTLAKYSINSMIGLWARDSTHLYHAKTSNDAFDGRGSHMRRQVEYGEGQTICDHIFATRVWKNSSLRPIHDQIIHTEATRMAQVYFILSSLGIPQRCIKDVKTDAFILQGVAKKRKAFVENIANVRFKDLPNLRRKYQKVTYNQTFLNAGTNVKSCSSDERVFRFSEDKLKQLQGTYSEPARSAEPPTNQGKWQQLSKESAEEHVLNGNSILVQGSPGTGKTYFVRTLVQLLREKGKSVDVISKTHAAVQYFGGEGAVTADHWVRRHVRCGSINCAVLVIDEITQIEIQLWNDIAQCLLKGIQIILSGDGKQFQAIAEHWCACPVKEGSLQNSQMLFELASGRFLELTENKRSDEQLFEFYTGIWNMTLEDALVKGRNDFGCTEQPANFTLVISHDKRKKINREQNLRQRPKDAIFLRAPKVTTGQGNTPQNMWIWKGLRLIGAGGKLLKGVFLSLIHI